MDEAVDLAPNLRLLRSHWSQVNERAGWSPQFTPGLPATWPDRRPRLVWYGFAYGYTRFPPDHLVDAMEVGCLWGRVEQRIEAGGETVLEYTALSETVEPVGVQGVHPVGPDHGSRADALARAERRVAKRPARRIGRRAIAAYAEWLSNHGTAAGLLPPEHAPFIGWIRSRAGTG